MIKELIAHMTLTTGADGTIATQSKQMNDYGSVMDQ